MKFDVNVRETLERIIEVEANNFDEAVDKVIKMYQNSEIILDDSDFITVEIGK